MERRDPNDGRGDQILLVEDDEALRQAMVRGLTKAGFRVAAAGSGSEAVELARAVSPDALIVDILLPDAGGLGVARTIRGHEPQRSIPTLFITALASPLVRAALGSATVLFKPFTYGQLVSSVRELIRAA